MRIGCSSMTCCLARITRMLPLSSSRRAGPAFVQPVRLSPPPAQVFWRMCKKCKNARHLT